MPQSRQISSAVCLLIAWMAIGCSGYEDESISLEEYQRSRGGPAQPGEVSGSIRESFPGDPTRVVRESEVRWIEHGARNLELRVVERSNYDTRKKSIVFVDGRKRPDNGELPDYLPLARELAEAWETVVVDDNGPVTIGDPEAVGAMRLGSQLGLPGFEVSWPNDTARETVTLTRDQATSATGQIRQLVAVWDEQSAN